MTHTTVKYQILRGTVPVIGDINSPGIAMKHLEVQKENDPYGKYTIQRVCVTVRVDNYEEDE